MSNEIKNTEFVDSPAPILGDNAPELLIKVYPYIMINADKERMFIQNNSVSITTISQAPLLNNGEFHNLSKDDNDELYFDLLAATVVEGKMDIATSTSVFGNTFQFEHRFSGITDQFFDHKYDFPVVFTFGEPFDENKFEKGELEVYTSNTITPASNYDLATMKENAGNEISEETLTEIDFVNIKVVESKFTNARVIFTQKAGLSNDVATFDGSAGISLGIEAHTLLHSLKAKGRTAEFTSGGAFIGVEDGEIDLISKEKWAPFKGTPASTREKLTMYWDWFDYDAVLPFVLIEKFKAGAALSTVITDPFDIKMIEDMLTVSAGYASNWDTAPVILTGTDTGKIQPTFRVGHSGIKVSVIAGKDPIKVINGIYENHIRRHPEFETNVERYQKAKGILNALSRYLYTDYAIGKGQNSYNQAYLPWYLEPYFSTPIKFDKKVKVDNLDKGFAGQQVDSFILDDGIKFQAKSLYFHEKFSDDLAIKGKSDLLLPLQINMSSQKLVQTDRKLTLPELPDNVSPIDKLPLPGDINTKSSEDLKYLFYLPIQDQTKFEEFMLNTLTKHSSVIAGTDLNVQVPRGLDGKVYTQQEANEAVLALQKGTLKTAPIVSNVETQKGSMVTPSWGSSNDFGRGYITTSDEWRFQVYGENQIKKNLAKRYNYEDYESIVLHFTSFGPGQDVSQDGKAPNSQHSTFGSFSVTHSEFTPAVVTTTSQTTESYSFQGRQVLFDKQEWKDFLVKFNILPNGFVRYSFNERPNWRIDKIDELIIQSLWGNELEIYFGTGPNDYIKVPMFNKDDETIATIRILFN